MRRRITLLGVILALSLPLALQGRWLVQATRPVGPEPAIVLPDHLGVWALRHRGRLSELELEIADPDAHVIRVYGSESLPDATVYLGLYAGRAGYGRGAHDPEVCYPASGWEILGSRQVRVRLDSGEWLHATELTVHRAAAKQAVLYWFQPARRWPAAPFLEEFQRVVDAIVGQPQYGFVRLSMLTAAAETDAPELRSLAVLVAPAVRAAVESLAGE